MKLSASKLGAGPVLPVENVVVFVAPPAAASVLRSVLNYIPQDFPAGIVILVHPTEEGKLPSGDNLNVNPRITMVPGADGVQLRNNRACIVEATANLAIGADGILIPADAVGADDALAGLSKPVKSKKEVKSNPLLASLASHYGSKAVAVALTALTPEEYEGFRRIRKAEGHTIALDEADRLWVDSSGPRVVPDPEDELLASRFIGKRLLAILTTAKPVAV